MEKGINFENFRFNCVSSFHLVMALSCYLGFGRKPGFNGNSVYLTTVEDLDDSVATVGEIEQLDGVCLKIEIHTYCN